MMRLIHLAAVCGTLAVAVIGSTRVAAEDFRVDTEVFNGEEKEPFAESLTLFAGGRVYDFLLNEPQEITIFDPQAGRFTLIDLPRKVKATITTADLLDCVFTLNDLSTKSNDPVFAFAAQPKWTPEFQEFEENAQSFVRVTLAGGPIEYRAVGARPPDTSSASIYRSASDWYARLNATRVGGMPPESRLSLNKELAERGLIPTRITRVITPGGRFTEKSELRSEHLANWTLSGADRQRIAQAGGYLSDPAFKSVSFKEFRALAPIVPANKQAKR